MLSHKSEARSSPTERHDRHDEVYGQDTARQVRGREEEVVDGGHAYRGQDRSLEQVGEIVVPSAFGFWTIHNVNCWFQS